MRFLLAVLITGFVLTPICQAQPNHVVQRLRAAAAQRYQVGGEWVDGRPYVNRYTIVPYKKLYFASTSGSDKYGMDFYAIWEYLDGKWVYIFEYNETDAGPEVEKRLDELYAKHRFSSAMRKKLTRGSSKLF